MDKALVLKVTSHLPKIRVKQILQCKDVFCFSAVSFTLGLALVLCGILLGNLVKDYVVDAVHAVSVSTLLSQ